MRRDKIQATSQDLTVKITNLQDDLKIADTDRRDLEIQLINSGHDNYLRQSKLDGYRGEFLATAKVDSEAEIHRLHSLLS